MIKRRRLWMKNILYFDEINRGDILKVGGKGANLGELYSIEFSVPYGFCVTTQIYRKLISNLDIDLKVLYTDENLAEKAKFIREKIIDSHFSPDDRDAIEKALEKLDGEFFSVRSSATNEDLPDLSFAGQQDTYLNVSK